MCGNCGKNGHNKRTCPGSGTVSPTIKPSVKQTRTVAAAPQAWAWRIRDGDKKKYTYKLQVEFTDLKSKPKIDTVMNDWSRSGEGWKGKNILLIFTKTFKNDKVWASWRKEFPYSITEFSSTSDTIKYQVSDKKTKTKAKTKKRKRKASKNICSFCCNKGHNKRTCAEYKKFVTQQKRKAA